VSGGETATCLLNQQQQRGWRCAQSCKDVLQRNFRGAVFLHREPRPAVCFFSFLSFLSFSLVEAAPPLVRIPVLTLVRGGAT